MESFPLSVNSVTLGPPPFTVAAALSPERRDERIGPVRDPLLHLALVEADERGAALVRVDRDLAVSRERQRLRNRAVGDGRGSRQENGQDSLKDVFHEEPLCGKTHSAENGSARRPGPGPSARVLGAKTRIEIERCNTRNHPGRNGGRRLRVEA